MINTCRKYFNRLFNGRPNSVVSTIFNKQTNKKSHVQSFVYFANMFPKRFFQLTPHTLPVYYTNRLKRKHMVYATDTFGYCFCLKSIQSYRLKLNKKL